MCLIRSLHLVKYCVSLTSLALFNSNIALFVRSILTYIRFISFAFAHYIRCITAHSLVSLALMLYDLALVTGVTAQGPNGTAASLVSLALFRWAAVTRTIV